MPLVTPILDDRKFQDIVDEAKKRIPHYIEEWTDHNVSDPGVTLIELFAWMTEMLLYRLNQVPDRHYIKFMEMLGITLKESEPARVPVTFWLTAPMETVVTIHAGTEVASTQTESEPSVIFMTEEALSIQPPELSAVVTGFARSGDHSPTPKQHNLQRIKAGFDGFDAFSSEPVIGDALYFGFDNDLSNHILGFELDCASVAGGAGINPDMPPYIWEASTGMRDVRWHACAGHEDTTKGMNVPGRIRIHLPGMGRRRLFGKELYWVRVRVKEISKSERADGMRDFARSPKLRQIDVASWGGTVASLHAQEVKEEFLGTSDGSAGQRYLLQLRPILRRDPGETLIVKTGVETETWTEVPDFANSTSRDRHFTLDSVTGELRLGPTVRQQDGTVKLYGAIPPRGATLIFKRYRFGGGQIGNVQTGFLNTLKTAIPYIARVSNRTEAWGGLDHERLEDAMVRAPALLRSRERAVTEDDFEFLARQALPTAVSRVKCLQPRPSEGDRVPASQIYLLVIPNVPDPEGFLSHEMLELDDEEMAILRAYLDERRLLTTRLIVQEPAYRWVAARVRLRAGPGSGQSEVEAEVLKRLYRFLNPLKGGPDGKGWPFGRELFLSDVYQALQGLPNVQFVRDVTLFITNRDGGPEGDPVESVDLLAHGVIVSGRHEVEFV